MCFGGDDGACRDLKRRFSGRASASSVWQVIGTAMAPSASGGGPLGGPVFTVREWRRCRFVLPGA